MLPKLMLPKTNTGREPYLVIPAAVQNLAPASAWFQMPCLEGPFGRKL